MLVARDASQGEVVRVISAAVLLGDDVVDLEWQVILLLRHLAVLAALACPFMDQVFDGFVHAD